ncbi:MAG TPA: hypothetical protein GX745_08180 [Clostridiales bacterium]|nr:hypothetical protein [Clostridiales bacterium]
MKCPNCDYDPMIYKKGGYYECPNCKYKDYRNKMKGDEEEDMEDNYWDTLEEMYDKEFKKLQEEFEEDEYNPTLLDMGGKDFVEDGGFDPVQVDDEDMEIIDDLSIENYREEMSVGEEVFELLDEFGVAEEEFNAVFETLGIPKEFFEAYIRLIISQE